MFQRLKNLVFSQYRHVVQLKPLSSPKGTVVLSYITWPFREGWDVPKARGHTNAFEVIAMAEAYQALGYRVEIVDYNNNSYRPPKDCCVVIDLHGQLERWNTVLPKNCRRVLHATGAHWLSANQAELTRLAALRDRRGRVLMPRRQVAPSRSAELADQILVLGNEYTMETFSFAQKPITRIPISSAYEFAWPEERDFSKAKKNFLWLGSYGMVHKGLDLVLEAFAQMPELSLTVCGRPEKEDDFFQCYEKELKNTSNIHLHGWIDMASPEFLKIANTHAGIIYPSCSEGGGGSVIHCMHAGMVPLCTREASVDLARIFHPSLLRKPGRPMDAALGSDFDLDGMTHTALHQNPSPALPHQPSRLSRHESDEIFGLGDFGMLIKEGNITKIQEALLEFSTLPDQEVEARAHASYEHVKKNHTRDCFQKNYRRFATKIISTL